MLFVYLLVALIVVLACCLIFLVIIQNSKGGGLAGNFQSVAAASQIVGVRKAADVVEKLTWYFMGGIVVATFLINLALAGANSGTEKGGLRMNSQIEAQRVEAAPTGLPNMKDIPQDQNNATGKQPTKGKPATSK